MASAAELGEARAKQVRAITLDRAKDVLKERQREKKLVDKWSKEYITVRNIPTQAQSANGEEIPDAFMRVFSSLWAMVSSDSHP